MTTKPTQYQRTDKGASLASQALTKMLIYFSDGNKRTFYSRDTKMKHTAQDRELGISRLKKYALANKGAIDVAKIYCNASGQELFTFKDGSWR